MRISYQNTTFSGSAPIRARKQRGSALLISLAILTLLTLGASVAMQRSSLQVKMTTNMQFKQQMFTAAYSSIESMMANLGSGDGATDALGTLITNEQNNVNAGAASGDTTIDIFSESSWTAPEHDDLKAVDSVSNLVSVDQLPSGKKYSLRDSAGNSAGTQAPYYFASQVIASNAGGNISSVQRQGFVVMGAAPQ
ncbi:pilus assembly PilX family protein [Parathalassolituus penaei]|uniref:Type 4 fimbrial biogenesis protein PilX N-terminal domain-containing protein n=1 Tax=Parathalassolituus penaei TaxID=2997323 RepID=A0A9X3EKN3_9GAMM|nr:PilX N-terminal domain-containing pilus assembly protein [Parathalassolituus penaei]MCY0964408.1 hypothetical protein [Parathalassolituus penaei]